MVLLDANGKFVAASNTGYFLVVNGVQVSAAFTPGGFARADVTQIFGDPLQTINVNTLGLTPPFALHFQ